LKIRDVNSWVRLRDHHPHGKLASETRQILESSYTKNPQEWGRILSKIENMYLRNKLSIIQWNYMLYEEQEIAQQIYSKYMISSIINCQTYFWAYIFESFI